MVSNSPSVSRRVIEKAAPNSCSHFLRNIIGSSKLMFWQLSRIFLDLPRLRRVSVGGGWAKKQIKYCCFHYLWITFNRWTATQQFIDIREWSFGCFDSATSQAASPSCHQQNWKQTTCQTYSPATCKVELEDSTRARQRDLSALTHFERHCFNLIGIVIN